MDAARKLMTLPILGVVCLGLLLLTTRGHEHAQTRHPEVADAIAARVAELVDGERDPATCEQFRVCWSPLYGTLMIQTRCNDLDCASFFKVTLVTDGVVEMTPVIPREVTSFCRADGWSKVIARDMYVCLSPDSPLYNAFLDMIR